MPRGTRGIASDVEQRPAQVVIVADEIQALVIRADDPVAPLAEPTLIEANRTRERAKRGSVAGCKNHRVELLLRVVLEPDAVAREARNAACQANRSGTERISEV